jgi:predicted DNA-binding transcriptional regulator YafY
MPRGDQTSRQWRLVHLLSGNVGRSLAQLQAELGVCKRTVQRDIAVLERSGFPVVSESRHGTAFWHFIEGFRADSAVSFELPELLALYFCRGLLRPMQGTAFYDALQSAMKKIGAAVPAQGHNLLNAIDSGILVNSFGTKDYSRSRQVIDALTKAVMHHYSADITHTAVGHDEAVARRLDPYKLWCVNNGLYVIGHDHRSDELRIFAVERIKTAMTTNRRFQIPADFDFEKMSESAFRLFWGEPQHVEIRFRAGPAPYVAERTWHPSQKLSWHKDGSLTLEMDVADVGEVKRWLIGFGAGARAIAPPELAKEINREVRAMKLRRPARK